MHYLCRQISSGCMRALVCVNSLLQGVFQAGGGEGINCVGGGRAGFLGITSSKWQK